MSAQNVVAIKQWRITPRILPEGLSVGNDVVGSDVGIFDGRFVGRSDLNIVGLLVGFLVRAAAFDGIAGSF